MAVKRIIPIQNIVNCTAGSTAVATLPEGLRYHELHFEYNTATAGGPTEANMELHLTEWRLKLDTIPQRTVTSAHLFDINRTKGKSPTVGASNGYAVFYFSEPQRETQQQREATAWGTAGVGKFTVEVDILATATTPVLTGWAVVDDIFEPPMGIVKWMKELLPVTAAAKIPFKLDTLRGDSYQGLYLFETNVGDIDAVLVEWDGLKLADFDENVYTSLMASSPFTVVSGLKYVTLDKNNPADAVPSVKNRNGQLVKVSDFLMSLTMAAAANVTMYREVIGSPN